MLTWPMAKRLKLFGITYLVGKISRSNFFFQGPGRLSENKWDTWGYFTPINWSYGPPGN